jgi:hypothetical protein
MRRIASLSACLFTGAVLLAFQPPTEASALPPAGLRQGVVQDDTLHLARRGFHGGGARGWRGGGRAFAYRGGGARGWRGGGRAFAYRGGGARVWRGGGRAFAYRGGVARGWRGGGRARVWRGGRALAWHGGRRVWRGGRWVWVGAGALAAPYYYYGGGCPLVRRTVWTPYGYRVRWVRRCY